MSRNKLFINSNTIIVSVECVVPSMQTAIKHITNMQTLDTLIYLKHVPSQANQQPIISLVYGHYATSDTQTHNQLTGLVCYCSVLNFTFYYGLVYAKNTWLHVSKDPGSAVYIRTRLQLTGSGINQWHTQQQTQHGMRTFVQMVRKLLIIVGQFVVWLFNNLIPSDL